MAAHRSPGVRDVDTGGRPLPWRNVLVALVLGSCALVAASWVTLELVDHPFFQVGGRGHAYLNVGAEGSVPTWWSTSLMTAAAGAFVAVGWVRRVTGHGGGLPWWSVATLLLLLAVDEATSLHEHLQEPAQAFASPEDVPFVWLVIGAPLALAVLVGVALVARKLPRETRNYLLLGLVVFFGGAIGIEAVASWLHARGLGQSSLLLATYHLEELLEMVGICLVVVAPLRAVTFSAGPGIMRLAVPDKV